MNELEKLRLETLTENGDKAYSSTGNNLIDLLFMADYFTKHLDEVSIGNSDKEKLFSMYMRDPRFGQGRRDLGRRLSELSSLSAEEIVKSGRFDDLLSIPTNENLAYLRSELIKGNELARKWMPRLTGKDKKVAKILCKIWELTEKEYRALIKTNSTVEYKLSYAEKQEDDSELNELFNKHNYTHPLVDTIDFEKVPSLAMTKYLRTFSTREDLSNRFTDYITKLKEDKATLHTTTSTVHTAYKTVKNNAYYKDAQDNADVIGKKIIDKETEGLSLNCICILDTSGSMGSLYNNSSLLSKAMSITHSLSTNSTYAKNQLISFSSQPQLMTIKGKTLKEQYDSMYTGDCSNTDFGKVMTLLSNLKKYPDYIIVISDMNFDEGSSDCYHYFRDKTDIDKRKSEVMDTIHSVAPKTKMIWWNMSDRNKVSPETDEYGNIYLSGDKINQLLMIPGVMDMDSYIDKLLLEYKKHI